MAWDNEKKKVKTAVAVAYEPGDKAPKILASGRGEVAEKIIAKAKENDVPFYKDNKLAETLSKLEIGDAIPPELYEVVAEILVFVDDMDKMKAKLQQAAAEISGASSGRPRFGKGISMTKETRERLEAYVRTMKS